MALPSHICLQNPVPVSGLGGESTVQSAVECDTRDILQSLVRMPSVAASVTMSDYDKMTKQIRAAYLMVKGSVAEDLQSRQELVEALQFAGNWAEITLQI